MRSKIILLTFFLSTILLQNCAMDSMSSYQQRRAASDTGATDAAIQTPTLTVDQDVINCSNSSNCHLEEIQSSTPSTSNVNSLIVAESDIITGSNINLAPAIKFQINALDATSISSVSYSYTKKDALGNIVVQTGNTPIYAQEGSYLVPIHSSNLGSSILTSAPYEQHLLHIIITASDNLVYSSDIIFHLSTHITNPIVFDRDPAILNSTYYKMNEDNNTFIIDTVSIQNTLPYAVTFNGSITVKNKTIAFLSDAKKIQDKTFVPKEYYPPYYYNYDLYNWFTTSETTYKSAIATPSYLLKIHRGTNTIEEVPITIQSDNDQSVLSFNHLELQGSEQTKIDVLAQFSVNNSLLGDHNPKTFYEGLSECETINNPEKCSCFYLPIKKSFSSEILADIYYMVPNTQMMMLDTQTYPSCSNINPSFIYESLFPVIYPEDNLALAGRDHSTNTSYTVTSWLKGYEDLDPIGTTAKTMEQIEATKGYVDYTTVDLNESYQGYVPGIIN